MPVEGHNSALEQESNSESEDKDLLLPWSTPASSPGRLQGQCCPGRLQRSSADSQGNTGPFVALLDSSGPLRTVRATLDLLLPWSTPASTRARLYSADRQGTRGRR